MLLGRVRQLGRAVEHMHRYRTIVGVFLKYGYEDVARRIPLPKRSRWIFPKTPPELAKLTPAERLRRAFEELGPTFIKFGQLLSTRSHLLPAEYVEELSKLHDQVPPVHFAFIRAVLESELAPRPLNECFSSIEETPLGSASIAQVHFARMADGTPCVIKVQRPGIEKTVRVDLQIMALLAALLEKHVEGWRVNRPSSIVAEFAKRLEKELDFTSEAAHVARFAHQFAGDPTLCVPKVYHETSTRRVLTMEYIEAIKASNFEALKTAELDRREIATRITDLVMKQIFIHGFFHADPHPGNIHILPDNRICFLDFGMMGFLDHRTRETFAQLIMAIAQQDENHATQALLKLANAELDQPRPGLESDMAEFMHLHFYRPMQEIAFARIISDLFGLTSRYSLSLPADLFTMLKALGLMENLVSKLDPGHDVIGQTRPFLYQLRKKQLGPKGLMRQWVEFGNNAAAFLRELPLEVRRVLAQVRSGQAKLIFRHEGLEPLDNTLERVSNRLSFALVLASLIISSSIVIHAQVPPRWHGVPVIGLVGYVVAGLMGFSLLISILRHGKM